MSAAETRENILAVSAGLLATRGLAGTTMRAIADGCGIRAASLYHHFASKDEIVAEIFDRSGTYSAGRFAGIDSAALSPAARVEALISATMESFRAHPEASQIFYENPAYVASAPLLKKSRANASAIRRLWVQALQDAMASGVVRDNIDPEHLWSLLHNMMLSTARPTSTTSTTAASSDQAAVDVVRSILLRGILSIEGGSRKQ